MKRLLIVGTSGSGKSTLARAVAARLGLPFVASDDYWWEPDWQWLRGLPTANQGATLQ